MGALVEGSAEHGLNLIAELERGGGSFVLLEGFVALPHFIEKEMIGAVELNEGLFVIPATSFTILA